MKKDHSHTISLDLTVENFSILEKTLNSEDDGINPDPRRFDMLKLSTKREIAGADIAEMNIKIAKTRAEIDSAPEQTIDPKNIKNFTLTKTLEVDTNLWFDPEAHAYIFLSGARWVRFNASTGGDSIIGGNTPVDQLLEQLNARNSRYGFRSPFPSPVCPECGRIFEPVREGQRYDRRQCADRAGRRRRYAARKVAGQTSEG